MASCLNEVKLIGHIGRDPEIRAMQNGDKIANLSIATSERWNDKQTGEQREVTHWHRVVIFGPLAEICEEYVHKGSRIYVCGQLETRKWTDQSGVEKYSTEVVLRRFGGKLIMLDSKSDGGTATAGATAAPAQQPASAAVELDDDIPF